VKAQLSWEFIATVFLFTISSIYFLFTIFGISPFISREIEAEAKRAKAFKISEILINDPGEPQNWEEEYFGPSLETYRIQINFSGYEIPVPNFSLLIFLNTSKLISEGKLDENCNGIRFVDTYFNLIPYYLESGCNSENTKLWVKVNLLPNQNGTVYMYYFTSSNSLSNPRDVFDLFDDFSDSHYSNERWYFENR